ncbi:MAG TPA: PAS domain S-box protein [Candidatus Sumerlaeota bacterium]|nr:PAS domain S-box protein [Candidatus Sumerlaeota bacterium]HPS01363.1 PAS domain S-box protein [Candidatus Sumerlaeota bacterium]
MGEQAAGQGQIVKELETLRLENARLGILVADLEADKRALHLKQERLEQALTGTGLGMWDSDLRSGETYYDPAWHEMLGYVPGSLGNSFEAWESLVHPDDLPGARVSRQAHIEGVTEAWDCEFRMRARDGGWKWIRLRGRAVDRDADGMALRIVGTNKDITQWKVAADALNRNRERLRGLVECSQAAIFSIDEQNHVHYNNPALEELTGYSRLELRKAENAWFFVHPDHHETVRQAVADCLQGEEGYCRIEFRILDKGGNLYWLDASMRRIQEGAHQLALVTGFDITTRKQVEADLARLATAVEQAAEVIVVTSTSRLIEYANPAFERLSGFSREEVAGQDIETFRSPADTESEPAMVWQTLLRGGVWTGRAVFCKRDGSACHVEMTASPVRDSQGHIVQIVFVFHDITMEEFIESRLRHSQKMEVLGTLAEGIAHDFNNLLQIILGYISMARDEVQEGSLLQECVAEIEGATKRASALTCQILAISRKTTQEYRPISFETVVKELLPLFQPTLPSVVELRLSLHSDCPPVLSDFEHLRLILTNLCTNAGQAMGETGGILGIQLEPARLDWNECESLGLAQPGLFVCLTVSDQGVGMAPEIRERIFEPYFTTREQNGGTGLGLAIVQGVVENHGGVVNCESVPGGGSTFRVYLPACKSDSAANSENAAVESPLGGNETLLFVDDEEKLVETARLALSYLGYQVQGFTDSEQAYECFLTDPWSADVAILDQRMPKLSGLDLAERLLAVRPNFPIILCTGFPDEVEQERLRAMGISEFLSKPIAPADLAICVEKILKLSNPV